MRAIEKINLGVIYKASNKWWNIDYIVSQLKPFEGVSIELINLEEISSRLLLKDLNAIALLPSEADCVPTLLRTNGNIKWVHSMFAGVDKFLNIKEIFSNEDVILTNSRGAFADSLAEFGIFSMLYFYYNTPVYMKAYKEKKWIRPVNTMIKNKTLTIVGYGQNGEVLAKKAAGFEMKIIGVKKSLNKKFNTENINESNQINIRSNSSSSKFVREIQIEELDSVLPVSDFIVSYLPHTPETIGLFDKSKFNLMKSSAVFINLGRGSSVVEEDLVESLKTKKLQGAILDVTREEPLKSDSPLYSLENVYLSCHSADNTDEYFKQAVEVFKKNLEVYLNTGHLVTVVDKTKGY
jgi:phosphoglycerate dehydrogenase-like enzyme